MKPLQGILDSLQDTDDPKARALEKAKQPSSPPVFPQSVQQMLGMQQLASLQAQQRWMPSVGTASAVWTGFGR